jgi:hypothetical protein
MRTDLLLVIQSKKAHFGQEKFGLPQLPDGTVTRHGLDERHRCAYERLLTTLKLPYPLGDSLCDANMYGFKPSLRRAAPTREVVRHRSPPILCAQTMKVVLTCAPPGLRAFSLRYVLLHATRVW